MKKLFLRHGKPWYNEFPEEPVPYGVGDEQYYGARMDDYNAAVSAAKASALKVVFDGRATSDTCVSKDGRGTWIRSKEHFKDGELMKEGQLYDPPQGWTVEIGYQHKALDTWETVDEKRYNQLCIIRAGVNRKVARLVPLKEQDKADVLNKIPLKAFFTPTTTSRDINERPEAPLKEQSSGIAAVGVAEYGDLGVESVSPPPQAESDEDLWAELGNKINKHMEPLDDAFGIHPLLDLYGRSEFTITRKAKP